MKVLAFNGSPHADGNTHFALKTVGEEIVKAGIEFEIIHVGNKNIRGCMACMACKKNPMGRCVINDEVNDWMQMINKADGILLGSPVHFAGIAATMKAFLDRGFYSSAGTSAILRNKVGAALVAVRRSGGMTAFQALNNYLLYCEMIVPTTNYWNIIHGRDIGESVHDEEGRQIMRILGKNMAWLLQVVDAGKSKVDPVPAEAKIRTNFIR